MQSPRISRRYLALTEKPEGTDITAPVRPPPCGTLLATTITQRAGASPLPLLDLALIASRMGASPRLPLYSMPWFCGEQCCPTTPDLYRSCGGLATSAIGPRSRRLKDGGLTTPAIVLHAMVGSNVAPQPQIFIATEPQLAGRPHLLALPTRITFVVHPAMVFCKPSCPKMYVDAASAILDVVPHRADGCRAAPVPYPIDMQQPSAATIAASTTMSGGNDAKRNCHRSSRMLWLLDDTPNGVNDALGHRRHLYQQALTPRSTPMALHSRTRPWQRHHTPLPLTFTFTAHAAPKHSSRRTSMHAAVHARGSPATTTGRDPAAVLVGARASDALLKRQRGMDERGRGGGGLEASRVAAGGERRGGEGEQSRAAPSAATCAELTQAKAQLWCHNFGYLKSTALRCDINLGIPTAIHRLGGAALPLRAP
ncbi:hypothetical protein HU200_040814 [Digitaria exilis]|uniref:Uncharacterized protein n=1 Tax=Digitaria exilis TaxID=1010633 RepID=A0A835B992_9POAL|nr:hypothetical protein HU200_040814 [Digitaria exilis]